jgi:hypothetical protein
MELKGKGAGSQGYPPRGLGQSPNSIESARLPGTRNSRKTDVHYRFLLTAGNLNDSPSATHNRGHADAESRPAYANLLSATGLPVCTHFHKSPEALGPEEIRSYQVYLTNEKKLAPGSILIAVAALARRASC